MLFKLFFAGVVSAGVMLSPLIANANSKEVISVQKSVLDEYKKINRIDTIDIHGVNHATSVVTLIPGSSFYSYLQENKIPYTRLNESGLKSRLDGYTKPDQVIEKLEGIAKGFPSITKLIDVGTSVEGRPIKGLEITNDFGVEKPVISFNGMHHARELMTVEVVLSIAEKITSLYKDDKEIQKFLNDFKIVVIPQVNPDGNIIVHEKDRWWRKNAWVNSRNRVVGVDLNRNYPSGWNRCNGSSGRQGSDAYRGPKPASEPETKAMLKFFEEYMPVANISYHAYSEMIIFPFGCINQRNTAKALFRSIANDMKAVIVDDMGKTDTYAIGTAPELLYEADGTDLDTHWQEYGVMSYTIELNSAKQGFQPDFHVWKDKTVEGQEQGWRQLIRSVSTNAVRFEASRNFDYVIKNDMGESFAGKLGPKAFKARGDKINYRPLTAGKYVLEVLSNNGVDNKTVTFEVNGNVVDLGKIL